MWCVSARRSSPACWICRGCRVFFPSCRNADVQTNAVIRTISEKFTGGMLGATPFTWALALAVLPGARRSLGRPARCGRHRVGGHGRHTGHHGGGLPDGRCSVPLSDGLQPGIAVGCRAVLDAGEKPYWHAAPRWAKRWPCGSCPGCARRWLRRWPGACSIVFAPCSLWSPGCRV